MIGRAIAIALAIVAGVSTSCSSSGDETIERTTTSTEVPADTTTVPPLILSLAPNLDLIEGQCYASLAPPTPVESTTTLAESSDATTAETVPPTLAATTTLVPRPDTVAIVDCAGSWDGTVYATYCLGPHETDLADLTATACPGALDLEYPGDRTIRRAAARVCLQRFEQVFGEAYATSTRRAEEFVPTEPLWNRDERRVVCLAGAPTPVPDPTATTVAASDASGS